MYHFFVPQSQIGPEEIMITGSDVNHIKNVLRMKAGEQIAVGNGQDRDYLCEIQTITADSVTASILSEEEVTELPAKLYLFQGLPKGDKMELIIQKAVELGVYQIIPVATKRTVVKLDAKKEAARVKRWNMIAESAAKQSQRVMIPEVTGVMTLPEALDYGDGFDCNLIPYENAEGMRASRKLMESIKPGMSAGIFIGPEGGFEYAEVELAESRGLRQISLGKRILRTETAGLTALAILSFQLECEGE